MPRLGFLFQLQLCFSEPVNNHAFALRCLPDDSARQRVLSSSLHIYPECGVIVTRDAFSLKHFACIKAPHSGLSLQAEGVVEITPGCPEAAAPVWTMGPYRRPSGLTQPGENLIALARELPETDVPAAVMELMSERFTYLPGSTDASTTAEEACALMTGVCQDEAHIMLSLLRMKGIPCRYVMGYMLGEGSTHAWVEVPEGGFWRGLDPTNRRAVNDEYIRIAVGRDANDCPVNRGIFTGKAVQNSQSCLSVWRI